jgi:hypothetical protein
MNGEDAEKCGRGLLTNTVPAFFWRKITKNLKIAGIRTRDFPNTEQEYYPLDLDARYNCGTFADFKFLI